MAGAFADGAFVTDRDEGSGVLANNDANSYLAERDAVIETGTNGNDLCALVVEN